MILKPLLWETGLDFREACKLLQLSGEFPCHVNLQPAPNQSSVAQGTNSALSIPVGWMIKEVSQNGNKKAKVQLR